MTLLPTCGRSTRFSGSRNSEAFPPEVLGSLPALISSVAEARRLPGLWQVRYRWGRAKGVCPLGGVSLSTEGRRGAAVAHQAQQGRDGGLQQQRQQRCQREGREAETHEEDGLQMTHSQRHYTALFARVGGRHSLTSRLTDL